MILKADKDKVTLSNWLLLSGEFNTRTITVELSEELLACSVCLLKVTLNDGSVIDSPIKDGKVVFPCIMKSQQITIGVTAYDTDENGDLEQRYSPEPCYYYVPLGSFKEVGKEQGYLSSGAYSEVLEELNQFKNAEAERQSVFESNEAERQNAFSKNDLMDICNGYDGTVYGTAGEAVREQVKPLGEIVASEDVSRKTEDVKANSQNVSSTIIGYTTYMTKDIMFGECERVSKIVLEQCNVETITEEDTLVIEFRVPSETTDVRQSTLIKSYEVPIIAKGISDYEIYLNITKSDLSELPNEFIFGIFSKNLNRFKFGIGTISSLIYAGNTITSSDGSSKYLGYYLKDTVGSYYLQTIAQSYVGRAHASPIITFVTARGNSYIDFDKIADKLGINESEVQEKSLLNLPEKFDLVVDDTFELFYKGIINVLDYSQYDFEIAFSNGANLGRAYKRKYILTPTSNDVGNKVMTVTIRDNQGYIIESQDVVLNIIKKPASPTDNKVVLCIGDSLSQGGYWQSELNRRLTANNGTPEGLGLSNIQFIGSKEYGGTKYEGYGGWRFSHYLSSSSSDSFMNISGAFDKTEADQHSIYKDVNGVQWKLETIGATKIKIIRVSSSGVLPSSGTLTWVSGGSNTANIVYTSSEQAPGNPFWNESTSQNDFVSYAERMGVESIDYVYILLGWNSTYESKETYMANCKTFIDGILAVFPNCKIGLIGLQVPSRNGFAHSYGISWKFYEKLQFVYNLQKWYTELSHEEAYEGKVEYINFSGQFDTENSASSQDMIVNVRSVKTENIQTNGVHPNLEGYMQLADVVYRNFCNKL